MDNLNPPIALAISRRCGGFARSWKSCLENQQYCRKLQHRNFRELHKRQAISLPPMAPFPTANPLAQMARRG